MDIKESLKELEEFSGRQITDLTELRHLFMKQYGWIREDEFYNECSIDETLRLARYICIDNKRERDNIIK